MISFELATSLVFTTGFALVVLQDYSRTALLGTDATRPRALRARAHFRPLSLSLPVAPRGVEIRPVAMRLRPEAHRLAA